MNFEFEKQGVIAILKQAHNFQWTTQGLGMLRLTFGKTRRLHLWHSSLRYPMASTMHSHPWGFRSLVLAGEVIQQRFVMFDTPQTSLEGLNYWGQKVVCGPGGGLTEKPRSFVGFKDQPLEHYKPGDQYAQRASEVHQSYPVDGTVTLIDKSFNFPSDPYVYWLKSTEWGTAESRKASYDEIEKVSQACLTELEKN